MKKWFLLLLVAAAVVGVVMRFGISPAGWSSSALALPDGTTVKIVGVTYGTNHVCGSPLAKMASGLPAGLRLKLGIPAAATQTTPKPSLVIWLDRSTKGPAASGVNYFDCFLADGKQAVSGRSAYFSANSGFGSQGVTSVAFDTVPRRDREISVHFLSHDNTGKKSDSGSLVFKNPAFGRYPQWKPETLPSRKKVGDVEVTLENFRAASFTGGSQLTANEEQYSHCGLSITSLSDSNEVWEVASDEVCDATGNAARNTGTTWNTRSYAFQPSLWPSEEAWKLRLEIKRKAGFKEEELVHLDNLPLGILNETNVLAIKTNYNGVSFTLNSIVRRPEPTNSNSYSSSELSQISFTGIQLPEGYHLDLISVTLDNGSVLSSSGSSSSSDSRSYSFMVMDEEAKTADLVIAIQKSRWVEFMVKPVLSEKL